MIFILWIIFTMIVGWIGNERKIGFWSAFWVSLFFSPLIGIIITLNSKKNTEIEYERDILNLQLKQQEELQNIANQNNSTGTSIIDELYKLSLMREKNLISEEEYQIMKEKIINS